MVSRRYLAIEHFHAFSLYFITSRLRHAIGWAYLKRHYLFQPAFSLKYMRHTKLARMPHFRRPLASWADTPDAAVAGYEAYGASATPPAFEDNSLSRRFRPAATFEGHFRQAWTATLPPPLVTPPSQLQMRAAGASLLKVSWPAGFHISWVALRCHCFRYFQQKAITPWLD